MLFGPRSHDTNRSLIQILAQDLDTGLALHSLVAHQIVESAQVRVPLLVCRGAYDAVVADAKHWQSWIKADDRIWVCPQGYHFFHFDYPRQTEAVVLDHWQRVDQLVSVASGLSEVVL
ncbi:MAG: hypothetical protein F6K31_21985 [Symploca sp. SIO2G7]|nr:hypothetical protein [Symploca sp. SIO2G7]